MNKAACLVWFRLDLRLADNAALQAALDRGGVVVPIFIHAPEEEAPWEPGAASRWWLHRSLSALEMDLRALGSNLILRRGPTLTTLLELVRETGARAIFWNRRYEPALSRRDAEIRSALSKAGLEAESFSGALLNEPGTIHNQNGKPFRVFTPFWKHCLRQAAPADPLNAPTRMAGPRQWPATLPLVALALEPAIRWDSGLKAAWKPGEEGAQKRLKRFLKNAASSYTEERNHPGREATSRLSPHLHFGEITPRQIWHAIRRQTESKAIPKVTWRENQFLTELGWREFAHHLLYHFPQTPTEPLRQNFKKFAWRMDSTFLKAWQRGRTGYPIVDAGMRELWTTGWMHNRVRMIVASFLVKDLLLPWQEGAKWFWDTLVDADLAQNTLGWQWTTGCGADAAPYFRVFNPVSQGEKFDPKGDYVRRWCPELAKLPSEWLHKPWLAPKPVLNRARLQLGQDYPVPIINHAIAREVALEAFARIKGRKIDAVYKNAAIEAEVSRRSV